MYTKISGLGQRSQHPQSDIETSHKRTKSLALLPGIRTYNICRWHQTPISGILRQADETHVVAEVLIKSEDESDTQDTTHHQYSILVDPAFRPILQVGSMHICTTG